MTTDRNPSWTVSAMDADGLHIRATVVCHIEPRREHEGGNITVSLEYDAERPALSEERLRASVVHRAREFVRRSLFLP